MYEEIVKELYERLEIQATDVFIVIHEPPNENWGLAGKQVNLAVLSVVIYVAQIVIQGKFDWGLFAVVTVYNAVINFVKGVKTSKKDLIVAGILWAVTTVILLVAHFSTLIATSTIL